MSDLSPYAFTTGGPTVLPLSRASVFRDGMLTTPRLLHPEGVAVGSDGAIWCSSELGQILRIDRNGGTLEEIATTGGFTLGLAFDDDRALYVCDLAHAAIFRLDLASLALVRFSSPGIRIPNYPVVDRARNRLLVSDSFQSGSEGPGLWSFDLKTGQGALLTDRHFNFANGLSLCEGGKALLVCETFARKVTRLVFDAVGNVSEASDFIVDLPGLPDGLAIDDAGSVYVGCYEPSRILRVAPDGSRCDIYIEDATAHLLAHPTNLAFSGTSLFVANLGRWHLTRIETDTTGTPLWRGVTKQ